MLLGSLFLFGCSKKIQNETLEWDIDSANSAYPYTNQELGIFAENNGITTNVASIDEAMSVLNQYDWEFVSSETKGDKQIYHVKRQARTKCIFIMSPNYIFNNSNTNK